MRFILLVALALLAFAGNSLLTRAALADPGNAPLSFAAVRLIAGALMLFVIAKSTARVAWPGRADLFSAAMLFIYAIGFSLAYVSMGAATGALILFSMVQFTMVGVGLWRGQKLGARALFGLALALGGLAWLLSPGLSAPPLAAAALMSLAGIAWGFYSTSGQAGGDPISRTARNFIACAAPSLVILLAGIELTSSGWLLAIASGAITSALGYVVWYSVLPKLSSYIAASLQLAVPVITMLGSATWLGETLTTQFILASLAILSGIALTLRKPA